MSVAMANALLIATGPAVVWFGGAALAHRLVNNSDGRDQQAEMAEIERAYDQLKAVVHDSQTNDQRHA